MKRRVVWGTMVTCLAMLLTLTTVAPAQAATTKYASVDDSYDGLEKARNGIPLLIIDVDESDEAIARANLENPGHVYGTIADMNGSPDHTTRAVASVRFDVPEEFENEYSSITAPTGELPLKFIRGRGKTTWGLTDKRPYRIQFEQPVNLFGMGKSNAWTLVANSFDESLLCDHAAYWLGEQIGLSFTPQVVPIDVLMVGSKTGPRFLGSYNLSEAIRFEKGRIEVPELDENDTDESTITGGYLLSIYSDEDRAKPESTYLKTNSGIQMLCEYPEFKTEDLTEGELLQRSYISDYVNKLDNLIMESGTIGKSEHDDIFALMDARSTADFWWMQEFSCNFDGYRTSSTYLYKDRESDAGAYRTAQGKLCWGPVWDFDMAWAEDFALAYRKPEGIAGFNHTKFPWLDRLRENDRRFTKLLKERWLDPDDGLNTKLEELVADGGVLDRYAAQIADSWLANEKRWHLFDYQDSSDASMMRQFRVYIEGFKRWIEARRAWVNEHLDEIGDVYYTMSYRVDGQTYESILARGNGYLAYPPVAPERAGMVFTGWKEAEQGDDAVGYRPLGDTTFKATYMPADDVVLANKAFFPLHDYCLLIGGYEEPDITLVTEPKDASLEAARWTTSNADVAIVTNTGQPIPLGVGETTITVSFPNGVSASYVLHVAEMSFYRDDHPWGISDANAPVIIEEGDLAQLGERLTPEGNYYDPITFSCTSSEPGVVSVYDDQCRVVRGEAPGTASVTITAEVSNGKLFETTRDVHVVEEGYLRKWRTALRLSHGLRGAAPWLVAACLTAIIVGGEQLAKRLRGKDD